MVGIVLLHITCYYLVNLVNSQRAPSAFTDFTTVVDRWIPHVRWTWGFYYFGDVYVTLWAGFVFWQISAERVRRAVVAYAGMIILGAAIQVAVPAVSPWPRVLTGAQQWVHDTLSLQPYASLPSMHVALAVLPAGIAVSVLSSPWLKLASTTMAVLITVSTVTMKEHYFLDAFAGFLLGVAAYVYWRSGNVRTFPRSTVHEAGDVTQT